MDAFWEDVFDWVKGYPSKPLGVTYRGGVLLFGGIAFLVSWVVTWFAFGFLGFFAGWLPSLLVAAIIGFLWPVLALGGVAIGVIVGIQYIDLSSPTPAPQVPGAAERLLTFRTAVCDLPNRFAKYKGKMHMIPVEQMTPEQKEEVKQYLLNIARDRAALDRIRKACDAEPGR